MRLTPENVLHLYTRAFIDELARAGVRDACVCPGSRSTPLALTLAAQSQIKLWMHLDERSAGFFALGLAKAARRPVALLCTSGTAAANFMPAVVEAAHSRVPLIVLTADRPPELHHIGAAQTIDQTRLYGPFAKWFCDVALPEATPSLLRYVRTLACRAAALAAEAPAGVAHLNFPFREPLVPVPPEDPLPPDDMAFHGRPDGQPFVQTVSAPRQVAPELLSRLADELLPARRGLIVAGPQTDPAFPVAVSALSTALGWPLLADPLSQVRCGPHQRDRIIFAYDAFLRDATVSERLAPEVILRFGQPPTSKPLDGYLQRYAHVRQIFVDGDEAWNDASRTASDVIHSDRSLFCHALNSVVRGRNLQSSAHEWLARWCELDRRARAAITRQIESFAEPFEGRVFAELAEALPDGATCYVSNSMPVRDLDSFHGSHGRAVRFLCNRGVNGIDGVVSSALGAAAAGGGPLVLVIGDLAFYHDMNGLLAAKRHGLRATIILLNNDGGGIFSFLPQAAHPEHFEELFGTPHGLDFRPAAELYGAAYQRINDWPAFRAALSRSLQAEGVNILEMATGRAQNVTMHRAVWQAVAAAAVPALDEPAPGT